jgi:hypothetical protein
MSPAFKLGFSVICATPRSSWTPLMDGKRHGGTAAPERQTVRLKIDSEADAPYLTLHDTEVTMSPEESPGIIVDNSVDNKIMGIAPAPQTAGS